MKHPALWKLLVPVGLFGAIGLCAYLQPSVPPASSAELADVATGYASAGKRELAQDLIQRVLADDPANYEMNFAAGLMAYSEERLADAQQHLEQATKARPDAVNAALTLGAVYQRTGALDKAVALYEHIKVVAPTNGPVFFNLAALERSRGQNARAIQYFKQYLRLTPAASDRAAVEQEIGRLSELVKGQTSS